MGAYVLAAHPTPLLYMYWDRGPSTTSRHATCLVQAMSVLGLASKLGRRVLAASPLHALGPMRAPLCVPLRRLCDGPPPPSEEEKARVLKFLRVASRPIQGMGKAKQTAGQKALDLTKQASRLEDLDLNGVLRCDTKELKKRGVPVQDRKRLLKFTRKYVQGWRWHPAAPSWWETGNQSREELLSSRVYRGWTPPYRMPDHPSSMPGHKPYQLDPEAEYPAEFGAPVTPKRFRKRGEPPVS